MKNLIAIFFALTVAVSAQENWGEAVYVWGDFGGVEYFTEPCFFPETNEILITIEHGSNQDNRILWLNVEMFFPDSLSIDGFHDISPFVSFDGNTTYFSSNRPGSYGGYDIWKSVKVDNEWTMPVNLGAEINSNEDECSPTLPLEQSEIYFHRGLYGIPGNIYFSEYINGNWSPAQLLPPPVNSSDSEYEPSISSDGNKLYFISNRPNGIEIDQAAWVSYRGPNEWLEPALLEGEINQVIYSGPDCSHYSTVSATIDILGSSIIFNKHGVCNGCPDGGVYISQLTTDISGQVPEIPSELSLSVYPNPFNSSISITTGGISDGLVEIYNLLGQEIREFDINLPGEIIIWNGKNSQNDDCPSGIYFVKLTSGNIDFARPVTLLR